MHLKVQLSNLIYYSKLLHYPSVNHTFGIYLLGQTASYLHVRLLWNVSKEEVLLTLFVSAARRKREQFFLSYHVNLHSNALLWHFNCFVFSFFLSFCCHIIQVDLLVERRNTVASPIVADLVSRDNVSLRSRLLMDVLIPEVWVYSYFTTPTKLLMVSGSQVQIDESNGR